MKSSIGLLFASVLLSSAAFAGKVGDVANYSGTISTNGNSYPATVTLKVVSAPSDGQFVVESTVTVMGQTRTQSQTRAADEVGDEAQAAQIVANCAAIGGISEAITIKSGETLQTCKITQSQNNQIMTFNVAAVPFMNARMVSTSNNVTTNLTLDSYVRGQ